MEKICGEIKLVGGMSGGDLHTQVDAYGRQRYVGSFRTATQVDALQIGNTSLTKLRCDGNVFNAMETGRDVCLYVFRTLTRKPIALGLKYNDTGELHLMDHTYYRNSLLQFATVIALLNSIGCWIAGAIIGAIVGLGQSAVPASLGFLVGLGLSWWSAWQFRQDYHEAERGG